MARTVAEINSYIVDNVVIQLAAIGITIDPTLWSKRNMLRLICYTFAIAQALEEQLQDAFMDDIEAVVAAAAAASGKWVQAKMFEFQYDSTNPQIVALINTVPTYPIVDENMRIIDACSVTTNLSNAVTIKVAKGNPFVALSALELSSAQGYINTIGIVGIQYNVISLNPDKLYVQADVYYQGQYAATILQSLTDTINLFLRNSAVDNFNGKIKMSDLEAAIRTTPGVNDVALRNVRGRADADIFAAGIDLYLEYDLILRQWSTISGYSVPENTAGKTLADSLNLIAE